MQKPKRAAKFKSYGLPPTNLVSDPLHAMMMNSGIHGDEFARVDCDDLLSPTIAQLEDQIVLLLVRPDQAEYRGHCEEFFGII